jgi:RimJ/RimL family protein N-acetyltransferase
VDHGHRIAAGRLVLRPLAEGDLDLTLRWRNESRAWFVHSDVILPDQHRAWYEKYRGAADDLMFVIGLAEEAERPVGMAALYRIDAANGCAEFGRLVIGDATARGKGLGLEATVALRDFAAETLGLSMLYLEVFASNAAAIRVYEEAGFVRESTSGDLVRMVWRR